MTTLTRRGFLAAGAALACASFPPTRALAGPSPDFVLRATSRVLDIEGRPATVLGLLDPAGRSGLVLDPGQRFRLDLANDLDEPTIIHWHGQIPPNRQDGVPDSPLPVLQPGERRAYDFAPRPGTHWMHSHVPQQEMRLLAAPLIVRSAEDLVADRQEVVLFLHDFSFRSPEELMATLTSGGRSGHDGFGAGMNGGGAMEHGSMAGMDHGAMAGMHMGEGLASRAMDLNDLDFDAYLANDRTLADPEVVLVERGGRVRLRIINGAAATAFWIDTGDVDGRLVAVDGQPVAPLPGRRFGLAMGQRLDLEIDLPGAGAFPILALREGARERTGLILATPDTKVARLEGLGEATAPAFDADLAQEARLRALEPLPDRPVDREDMLLLSGAMSPYLWTLDGRTWGEHRPILARNGERVELTFHNMSMMAHPMHLHGHAFQVVGINGRRLAGAVRDTVLVPSMAMVTVALDAGEAARWMLHCHHMPHLMTGMMTEFVVES